MDMYIRRAYSPPSVWVRYFLYFQMLNFWVKFTKIMFKNLQKKKYNRLRRKLKKQFLANDREFHFTLEYLWDDIIPSKEEVDYIISKTISKSVPTFIDIYGSVKDGVQKHHYELCNKIIPFCPEFKREILGRLEKLIIQSQRKCV